MSTPRLVKDLQPGSSIGFNGSLFPLSSNPIPQLGLGSNLLFSADVQGYGSELWISDGTEEGTKLLTDATPPGAGNPDGDSHPFAITKLASPFQELAFFIVEGKQVWRTDGTSEGTFPVSSLDYDLYNWAFDTPRNLTAGNDYVYYFANGQLWVSAGLQEGAESLGVVYGSSIVSKLGSNTIYFLGKVQYSDPFLRLWSSGPFTGTVANIDNSIRAQSLTATRDHIYLLGEIPETMLSPDEQGMVSDHSVSPKGIWRVTDSGLSLIFKSPIVASNAEPPFSPFKFERFEVAQFGHIGNILLFTASREDGEQLWTSNGTTAGTLPILAETDLFITSSLSNTTNQHLYFTAYTPSEGYELWVTDGASAQMVNPIGGEAGFMDGNENLEGVAVGDDFYFKGPDFALWRTNAVTMSTTKVSADNLAPFALAQAGNDLFFSGWDDTYGNELWALPLISAQPGVTISPISGLTTSEAGDTAYFTVVLNTQPTADVSIAVKSSDPTEGLPALDSITFTSSNWNIPQVVTVTGVNDDLRDREVSYSIITEPVVSDDTAYAGIDPINILVTNADDDTSSLQRPQIKLASVGYSYARSGMPQPFQDLIEITADPENHSIIAYTIEDLGLFEGSGYFTFKDEKLSSQKIFVNAEDLPSLKWVPGRPGSGEEVTVLAYDEIGDFSETVTTSLSTGRAPSTYKLESASGYQHVSEGDSFNIRITRYDVNQNPGPTSCQWAIFNPQDEITGGRSDFTNVQAGWNTINFGPDGVASSVISLKTKVDDITGNKKKPKEGSETVRLWFYNPDVDNKSSDWLDNPAYSFFDFQIHDTSHYVMGPTPTNVEGESSEMTITRFGGGKETTKVFLKAENLVDTLGGKKWKLGYAKSGEDFKPLSREVIFSEDGIAKTYSVTLEKNEDAQNDGEVFSWALYDRDPAVKIGTNGKPIARPDPLDYTFANIREPAQRSLQRFDIGSAWSSFIEWGKQLFGFSKPSSPNALPPADGKQTMRSVGQGSFAVSNGYANVNSGSDQFATAIGSTVKSINSGNVVSARAATLLPRKSLVGNDSASYLPKNGAVLQGSDLSRLVGNDSASLVGNDSASYVPGILGGALIANGGGNLIANGGGNLVAQGGGT